VKRAFVLTRRESMSPGTTDQSQELEAHASSPDPLDFDDEYFQRGTD
jgi:DNA polymerase III sliding clamp (beta) subunit (PCNA family)